MAELEGIPYAVQDLTNPSLAMIESVGLAARIHTIKGVEANSRQFFPKANEAGRQGPSRALQHKRRKSENFVDQGDRARVQGR